MAASGLSAQAHAISKLPLLSPFPKPHHITTPASDPRYQQHTTLPVYWRVLHEALATGQRASWTTSTARLIVTTQVTGETGYVETFSYKLCAPNAPAHRDDLAQPQKDRTISATQRRSVPRLSRDISTLQMLQGADTIIPTSLLPWRKSKSREDPTCHP